MWEAGILNYSSIGGHTEVNIYILEAHLILNEKEKQKTYSSPVTLLTVYTYIRLPWLHTLMLPWLHTLCYHG